MKIIFNPSFLVRRMTHVLGEATSICRHGRRCHFSGGGGGVNFISPLSPSSILPPTPLKTPPSPTPIQRGRGNEVFLPFLLSPPSPSWSLPQQVCIAKRGEGGHLAPGIEGGGREKARPALSRICGRCVYMNISKKLVGGGGGKGCE